MHSKAEGCPIIPFRIWRFSSLLGLVYSMRAVARHLDSHRFKKHVAIDESTKKFPELCGISIVSACGPTRESKVFDIMSEAGPRIFQVFQRGVGTVECKSIEALENLACLLLDLVADVEDGSRNWYGGWGCRTSLLALTDIFAVIIFFFVFLVITISIGGSPGPTVGI